MDRAIIEFGGFVSCLDKIEEKGCIYGNNAWEKGDIINTQAMKEAYEMGKNI